MPFISTEINLCPFVDLKNNLIDIIVNLIIIIYFNQKYAGNEIGRREMLSIVTSIDKNASHLDIKNKCPKKVSFIYSKFKFL